jgi:hypothetical protein
MLDDRILHLLETLTHIEHLMEVKEGIMQAQIEKGMLLGETRAKAAPLTIKEITPFGIRAEYNDVGQFSGVFTANTNDTVTGFLKNDGTSDWEVKGLWSTKEGDIIVANAHGTGKMTGPNTSFNEGEVLFMTQSPKLSYLNNKKWRVEVTGDMATGESHAKFFAL